MKKICMSEVFGIMTSLLFCVNVFAQFASEIQSTINNIVQLRIALIVQKSEFDLIGENVQFTREQSGQAYDAFNVIEEKLKEAEGILKNQIHADNKVLEEGYYNTVMNRIKNFINRMLGYKYTEAEQYIARKTIEGLQESVKMLEDKRKELLFRIKTNEELELHNDVRRCDVLIKKINNAIYELQPIPSRMMSAIRNTFWRS